MKMKTCDFKKVVLGWFTEEPVLRKRDEKLTTKDSNTQSDSPKMRISKQRRSRPRKI